MSTYRMLSVLARSASITVLAAVALASLCAQSLAGEEEDGEIKLGRASSAEHDKTVKLITDKDMLERLNRIAGNLALVANSTETPILWGRPGLKVLPYSFKIVDDKDVNAYSMPGGFIYVNKGLLDFAKSDDELAGVLAHEITHAAHHHMMKLLSEQEKIQWVALGPALASILLGRGGTDTTANLLLAGQLYTIAKVNSYGVEAEKDADNAAVHYLMKTRFNPVGLLTFMERLARQERLRPGVELGIYRTHPPSLERSQALIRTLARMKVAINRREVDPTLAAKVQVVERDAVSYADVSMNGTLIARLAGNGTVSAEDRAKALAKSVDTLFDDDLVSFELGLSSDKTRVLARRRTLIALTDADARGTGRSVQQVAEGTLDALRNLLWQDQFNRTPMTSSTP